ncbi:hypothetical protein PGIGA_G00058560 [Pangasianodon gigas]|uniref:Uncharacterized protein n=1 Tax=Pangasianodon gigas TaxID=30993 RepID=A0ACC5X4P3_PANGG|nr:hypothetical protein [Pangasianodon gigas]
MHSVQWYIYYAHFHSLHQHTGATECLIGQRQHISNNKRLCSTCISKHLYLFLILRVAS